MSQTAAQSSKNPMRYRRVLIKVSGEALMGDQQYGHDIPTVERICRDIKEVVEMGVQLCLVVGGGNIYRGMAAAQHGMERASADYMGMLATVLNALALQNALEKIGCHTRVQSAIEMREICEPYIRRRAIRHMEHGRIVIFAAGTGNPFFSTDTAAALRAAEMGCDAMMKATKVDGVYDKDPAKHADAKHYERLSYSEVLIKDLRVMDATAIALSRENSMPILVGAVTEPGQLCRILSGTGRHTIIVEE